MLFVVFFLNSYVCWIVRLSPLTWPGVGDLVLSHPHHLVCTVFALSCYCSPVVSVSDSASGFLCVCVCMCTHACMSTMFPVVWLQVLFSLTPGVGTAPPLQGSSWTDWKCCCCRLPLTATLQFFTSHFRGDLWVVIWRCRSVCVVKIVNECPENENMLTVEGFKPFWCWCHWHRADDDFSCFPQEQKAAYGSDFSLLLVLNCYITFCVCLAVCVEANCTAKFLNLFSPPLVLHPLPVFPTCSWFHGKITREQAERLLYPPETGLFLVRESTNYPGDYTLCVSCDGKVEHYRIIYHNGKLTIDEEEYFENLMQLVEVRDCSI